MSLVPCSLALSNKSTTITTAPRQVYSFEPPPETRHGLSGNIRQSMRGISTPEIPSEGVSSSFFQVKHIKFQGWDP